jgi:hypothetical protein
MRRLLRDTRGLETVQYVLMGLVLLALIGAVYQVMNGSGPLRGALRGTTGYFAARFGYDLGMGGPAVSRAPATPLPFASTTTTAEPVALRRGTPVGSEPGSGIAELLVPRPVDPTLTLAVPHLAAAAAPQAGPPLWAAVVALLAGAAVAGRGARIGGAPPPWLAAVGHVLLGLLLGVVALLALAGLIYLGGLLLAALGIGAALSFVAALVIAAAILTVVALVLEIEERWQEYTARYGPPEGWTALKIIGLGLLSLTGGPQIVEAIRGRRLVSERPLDEAARWELGIGGAVQGDALPGGRARGAAGAGARDGGGGAARGCARAGGASAATGRAAASRHGGRWWRHACRFDHAVSAVRLTAHRAAANRAGAHAEAGVAGAARGVAQRQGGRTVEEAEAGSSRAVV